MKGHEERGSGSMKLSWTDFRKLAKSLGLTVAAATLVAIASWFDALPTEGEWDRIHQSSQCSRHLSRISCERSYLTHAGEE